MAVRQDYFDLLDWLESRQPVDPKDFFNRLRSTYGILHVLYVDAVVFSHGVRLHRLHHTLSTTQERAFATIPRDLLPALTAVLSSVRPVEHSSLSAACPKLQKLAAEAEMLGISANGISYPLVSPAGRAAAISISVPVSATELPHYLRSYGRDIYTLSALFHAALIEAESSSTPAVPPLTPREREVLRWSASGKSYWEIATILGISERTVRFFMNNARRKLDVVSNTQAVAEAVWRGLIPLR